jgi:O-antigen/teichoic acid export membrane protein
MLSMTAVGIYNIGQSFANVFFVFMANVWQAFQPAYYREVFDRGEKASVSVGRIFSIFSYITLFPIMLGVLFAQEIVYFLFPSSYYGAIDIVIVLAAGVTTQTFGMYISIQFAYSKRPFWIFPVTVVGTIINVILNIYLIPKYGLIGAGLATVASVSGVNLILTYIGQKLYKIQYEWKSIAPLFINVIAAIIVTLCLRATDISNVYLYLIKFIFLSGFIYIGIRSKIISPHSIQTVVNSLFRISQKAA